MARPKKATVDYFPHVTDHGKTMFILEGRFGNDGYAVFFKILEQLGKSDGHYINCNDVSTWEFLTAYCRVSGDLLREILNLCSTLGAIDSECWADSFIFSQNFVDGVKEAYRQRKIDIPNISGVSTVINSYKARVSTVINPQMKVNEMKVNETITPPSKMTLFEIRQLYREKIGQEAGGGVNQELSDFCQSYTPEAIKHAILTTSTTVPLPKNPFMYMRKVLENTRDAPAADAYDPNKVYPPDSFYYALQQSERGQANAV